MLLLHVSSNFTIVKRVKIVPSTHLQTGNVLIANREPFIDLPPCNSFCRMLTHKLADYYHMTHQVDAVAGAVRIFRTPFCRLPASLTTISNPPTTGNTPPPTMPTMKIMRRGGDGDTGPSPSKATSETGSDGKDKSLSAKEKYVVYEWLSELY